MGRMGKLGTGIGAAALAAVLLTTASLPAAAAPRQKAGSWGQLTTTTAQVAAGFPSATVASSDPTLAVATTATMSATTPPGQVYGTSAGSTYLSVSPVSASVPSSTTITFAAPTPPEFWSFVFGDIDSESVQVSATAPDGSPVAIADLGFRGAYNSLGQSDQPNWDAATGVLSGNVAASDGASGWFSPTVPLSTLTFTSTTLNFAPRLQFWMVGLTASLSGRVVDTSGAPVANATVAVQQPDATPLPGPPATAVTDGNGAYDIPVFPSAEPVQVVVTPADRAAPDPVVATPTPDADGVPVFDAVDVTAVALPTAPPTTPPAVDPADTAPTLPATGVSAPGWLIGGAIAAVVLGLALAVAARIRRRSPR
ncbi:carboxypeptidase-like regulatory domain-containing protein [Schumannella sp. 10F1B-5-1]|uniref:carboxypeptidase-like regulatory domain-containing protein n=1 Tax=Schumannella sp. 10F1B-5-1 TaxID=2590780 RepID=UPI00113278F4|nr:carboxypeptidase-like regulatory domain-containing protein [Schumannella sp. 10F1B-5-1]TPW71784.1 carboxypeptidase regulatory-like domain-containing protein [Schumannella sp. 10F1B-5-1]